MQLNQIMVGVALFLATMSVSTGFADYDGGYRMHDMGAGGWVFGPLMMILMVALIAGAVVLVLRLFGIRGGADNQRDRAIGILNERFAKGEIDKEEFESRRQALDK